MKKLLLAVSFLSGCAQMPVWAAATNVMMENVRGSANSYYFNTASSYTVLGSTVQFSSATVTVGAGLPASGTGLKNIAVGCVQFPSGFQCTPGISSGSVITSVSAGYGMTNVGTANAPILSWINTSIASMTVVTSTITTLTSPAINGVNTLGFSDATTQTTAYPGASGFIQNTSTLQSGATFYTSSGTATTFNTTTLKFADGTSQTSAGVTTTSTNTWTANQTFSSATITTLNVSTITPTFIVGATNGVNKPIADFGYYVSSVTQTGGISFPSSTQYGDLVSLTLPAGNWLIIGNITGESNSATITSWQGGISTTAGNSATGLTIGQNLFFSVVPATTRNNLPFVPIYVQITGSTTYYLKLNANYSVAVPIAYASLAVLRMP